MVVTTPTLVPTVAAPKRQLTLFDSTCIIVGIIIGSSIFARTPFIAFLMRSTPWLVGAWVGGGLITLIGALVYAELGTTYPENGGDYVYLTRAYGRGVGFWFAWSQLWIIRPGSIGAMAYIFAQYANRLYSLGEAWWAYMIYAVAAIVGLTLINVLGIRQGKWTQNGLTVVKVAGLGAIFVVGMVLPHGAATTAPAMAAVHPPGLADLRHALGLADLRLAMIFILFAYAGWYEMASVGAEVKNPQKNILRALVLGTVACTIIYLLTNLAFVYALSYAGFTGSKAVAADVMVNALGDWAGRFMSCLICVSALGAANGLMFTGARMNYALGREHRFLRFMGWWDGARSVPTLSLLVQTGITLALVVGFGWNRGENGFDRLVTFTTPVFWLFFLLVGVGLVVLRYRDPAVARPYRVPWYPLPPILFCGTAVFMIYAGIEYAVANRSPEAFWSLGALVVGGIIAVVEACGGERQGGPLDHR